MQKNIISCFFLALALLSKSLIGQTNLCFNSTTLTPSPVGNKPFGLTNADFNGDGKMDIVVANQNSNNISILLNIGNGQFASAVNYNVGTYPLIVKASDFNEDGKQDVVVVNNSSNNISVLFGNGNGTFNPQTNYSVGLNPFDIACADFNGDNHIDLAVTNETSNNTLILIGSGLGTFSTSLNVLPGAQPRSVAVSDFNGDGKKDLAIVNLNTNNVSLFMGTGTGSFSSAINYTVGSQPSSIVCADFNGDGSPELAVTNFFTEDKIYILINNGNGTFASAVPYNAGGSGSWSLLAADFNNDGKTDVAIANTANLSLLYGTGAGSFLTPISYPSTFERSLITVADFNFDGSLDIAMSFYAVSFNNTIKLYIGDGSGGFVMPKFFAGGFSPTSGFFVTTDLNSDGKLDFVLGAATVDSIAVIMANSSTSYAPPVHYKGGAGSGIGYFVTADFNSDSKPDIAFSSKNASNVTLTIKLGNGTSGFMTTNTYSVTSNGGEWGLTCADYNNDGKPDIAIAYGGNNSFVSVFFGVGDGTFIKQQIANFVDDIISIYSIDLNNDGNVDIAVGYASSSSGPKIIKLINNGFGSFTSSSFNTPQYANSIAYGDFNADGKTDLATIRSSTLTSISVFLGLGSGVFGSPSTFSTGVSSTYPTNPTIVASDFNNDGKLDLAASNYSTGNISFFLGQGTGTFLSPKNYNILGTVIFPADYNNDGMTDLAVLGLNGVATLLNRTTSVNLASPSCVGTPALLQATKGADVYTWSPSLSTGDTMAITTSGVYSVTISYSNSGCAISTSSINVNFYPTPIISIASSQTTICVAGVSTLTANGALNYLWNNNQSTSNVSVSPTTTTTYTVTGFDTNNCSNTETVSVTVDPTCADVWPGDANSDGLADNLDILELGLHYTQTGAPRTTTSNTWQSYFSNNWSGTITNGKNLNHSDCNGDGTINNNDTLAIYNNYGLSHAFKTAQTNTVNPQLSIVPDQASVVGGVWGTSSIYLGDVANSINNINGIAYTIDFDNTLIEPNSIYVEYQNSFLDASQNLHFRIEYP